MLYWTSLGGLGFAGLAGATTWAASVSTAAVPAPERLRWVPVKSVVLGAESPPFASGRQLALEEP